MRAVVAPVFAVFTVFGIVALGASVSLAGAAAPNGPAGGIDVGLPTNAYIEIGTAVSASLNTQLAPPGTAEPLYVPPGQVNVTNWVAQTATEPDPSTNPVVDRITPRTAFMLQSALGFGLTRLSSVQCVSGRSANPTSDHPLGRACDFMYNFTVPSELAAGWRAANWLVANQAALGVKYVIWQGMIWNATSRPGPWTQYVSAAYGCPNPANVTGCHYDHVHVSMF
jgi:hypothetical protein